MSISLTASTFKMLFPEFAAKEDALVELRITMVKPAVSSSVFGATYGEAILTLVAHEFAYTDMAADGDEFLGKEMTSYSPGSGGASFGFKATSDDKDSDYKATVYGRKFLALRERTGLSIPGAI